jgi:hypothetical protein
LYQYTAPEATMNVIGFIVGGIFNLLFIFVRGIA